MKPHTPGPWYVVAEDGSDFTAISTEPALPPGKKSDFKHEVLGSSEWLRVHPKDLELMAKAPELLKENEALKARIKELEAQLQPRWNGL